MNTKQKGSRKMPANHKHDDRVLFICRKRNSTYGISIGLVNSAQFICNFLNQEGIEAKVVTVVDSNGIDKEVYNYKPSHVIIHALWVPPYKLEELAAKYPKIIWQVRVHSKIPFLAHEGMAMEWINEYYIIQETHPNIQISGNSMEFKEAIEVSLDKPVIYLPNMYMPDYPAPPIERHSGSYLNIGCFGAIRPFKNHLLQAMAAIAFGDKINRSINFHVNSDRSEQNGQSVLKNLQALFAYSPNHNLVECKWEFHKEFLKTVAKMDIGMQVSLTETYNIVAADFVYVGIPIVVSKEIDWMPNFTQSDPYDINCMINTLHSVYRSGNFLGGRPARWLCQRALEESNEAAGKKWLKYLDEKHEPAVTTTTTTTKPTTTTTTTKHHGKPDKPDKPGKS